MEPEEQMARIKPFDEDDMSNFAFDRHDDDEKTDEDLLNDWNTEGPEDEATGLAAGKKKKKKQDDDEEPGDEELEEPLEEEEE